MSQRHIRTGFVCFLVLSVGFIANIFWLQPNSWRNTTQNKVRVSAPVVKLAKPQIGMPKGVADKRTVGDGTAQSPMVLNPSVRDQAAETSSSDANPSNGGSSTSRDLVRAVQRELQARGYRPGAEDGISGSVTRAAIMAYQVDNGLPVTSDVSEGLLQHIVLGTSPATTDTGQQPSADSIAAMRDIVANVQTNLTDLAYYRGSIDGQLSAPLSTAISNFEKQQRWRPTGRISGRLVGQLANSKGTGALANKW